MPGAAPTTATAATVAGTGVGGSADGPAAVAGLCDPWGVAVAPDGSYFVADFGNHRVRRVAPNGVVSTVAGTGERGGADGPGEVATLYGPIGIAVDRAGAVFVTEYDGCRVRKIARAAGGGWAVSTVSHAGLRRPRGIAVGPAGRLVVADSGNHRVVRVDPSTNELTVIAGSFFSPGFADGPLATARFLTPSGVAVDRRGDVFICEIEGDRVRQISAAGGTVTTVAGGGARGDADGAGVMAQFRFPWSIAVDGRGVLLVGDASVELRLRRVAASADRTVTTVAVVGAPGNGIGGSAIDHDGNLLIAVPNVHRVFRVMGLGLVPPSAPGWSLRAHRGLARAVPAVGTFVTTVMLCALRLDARAANGEQQDRSAAAADPRLPLEMWLAILSMLRPDQLVSVS